MKTIFKYALEVTDTQTVDLPADAVILTVQLQNGDPMLWALIDADTTQGQTRKIHIYGTGHPIRDRLGRYLSTFQMQNGRLVFHVFEGDS